MKCRYSKAEILAILREYDSGESPSVVSLCAKHRISRQAYYYWRAKYGSESAGEQRLAALEQEVRALRALIDARLYGNPDMRLPAYRAAAYPARAAA
ncbi:transposase [Solimonas flava]|uniref:transposase n=1 Tax=Solimonas flava TaxID=415849 RepID=UPI000428B76E|nr:transposase [Solimonas flava]